MVAGSNHETRHGCMQDEWPGDEELPVGRKALHRFFMLQDGMHYLNHGSYGACLRCSLPFQHVTAACTAAALTGLLANPCLLTEALLSPWMLAGLVNALYGLQAV